MKKFLTPNNEYLHYIKKSRTSQYNILEGSVRSSKTVINILSFALCIEEAQETLFLAIGKSVAHAKLVIGESDGFGLAHILPGAEYCKYHGNDALKYTDICGLEKFILFVGGLKIDSFKSYHGYSIAAVYITEIQMMHKETVINALERMFSSKVNKIFVDLNPISQNHPLFTDFIDVWIKAGANYKHATMLDNPTMTPERIAKNMKGKDRSSVDYKRNVLGLRVNADGIIFTGYRKEKLSINTLENINFNDFSVGIDFGTRDRTVFTLIGFSENYKYATVISTWSHKNPKDGIKRGAVEYIENFIEWINPLRLKYPRIRNIWVDSASGGFKRSLAIRLKQMSNLIVRDSNKGDGQKKIISRILFVEQIMTLGSLRIYKDCTNLFDSLGSQVWDSKAQEKGKDVRLDNGTVDIDSADSFEYAVYPYKTKMLRRWGM